MPAWIGAAASVVGGLLASSGSSRAADTQAGATAAAVAEQRRQADRAYDDQAPYRAAGQTALGQLATENNQAPTAAQVMSDPGYQFGLQQGQLGLDRKAAAAGGRVSGAALNAASQFATNYAAAGYGAAYQRGQDRLNRLASLAGIGQTSTSNSAAAGAQSSNAISNLISSQGNASGASQLAQGNIWGNTANQIGALYGRNVGNTGAQPSSVYPYNNGNVSGSDQFGWKGPGGF